MKVEEEGKQTKRFMFLIILSQLQSSDSVKQEHKCELGIGKNNYESGYGTSEGSIPVTE